MKLNIDCIKDILLDIEDYENDSRFYCYTIDSRDNLMVKYTEKEIEYHLDQMRDCGLIEIIKQLSGPTSVKKLTFDGHYLIDQIRSDTVWNKIKETGIRSIPSLIQIAAKYFT